MSTFRTKPPLTYLPPSREEMRDAAQQAEVRKFSADLVEDFCNLAAGGEILPPSEWRDHVRREADEKLPKPDSDGDWSLSTGGYTKNRTEAVNDRVKRGMKYQQAVCDFLQTVELDKFPGSSPLEQAMNMLKLLATQNGGEPGGDGETLPIFQEGNPEKTAERLNDIMDDVESLSDEEQELLDSDDDDGSGDEDGRDDDLATMKLAEDMARGKDVWLKVSRQLDQLARMKVAKSVKVIPDPEGEEVRVRSIEHLGEIPRLQKTEWALPSTYRNYRLISKSAMVRERVRREEKQQLLYLICDCSGSMKDGQRIAKAGGVIMNRLKAVVAGEAQMYVRFFDSRLYEEHYASTPAEAKELMRRFEAKNFSGGSTAIDACAREAQKRIEEIVAEGRVTRPELVVVTDGDDSVRMTTEDLPGTKLHAFVVERSNKALTDLAVKTGGVGIDNL